MEHRSGRRWIGRAFTLVVLFFLGGVAAKHYFGAETFEGWVSKAQSVTGLSGFGLAGSDTVAAWPSDYDERAGFATRLGAYVKRVTGSASEAIKTYTGVDVAGVDVALPKAPMGLDAPSEQGGAGEGSGFGKRVADYSRDVSARVAKTYKETVGRLTRSFGFGMDQAAAPESEPKPENVAAKKPGGNPFRDTNVMDFAEGGDGEADGTRISGLDADRRLKTEETTRPAAKKTASARASETRESRQKVARLEAGRTDTPRPVAPKVRPVGKLPRFDIVSFDMDGEGVAAGEAEPNWRVSVMSGGRKIAGADVDAQGRWVILFDQNLKPGDHKLSLVATPPDGRGELRSRQTVDVRFRPGRNRRASSDQPYVALLEPGKATRVLQKPKRVASADPRHAEPQKVEKQKPVPLARKQVKPAGTVKMAVPKRPPVVLNQPSRQAAKADVPENTRQKPSARTTPGWWNRSKEKAARLAAKTRAAAKAVKDRAAEGARKAGARAREKVALLMAGREDGKTAGKKTAAAASKVRIALPIMRGHAGNRTLSRKALPLPKSARDPNRRARKKVRKSRQNRLARAASDAKTVARPRRNPRRKVRRNFVVRDGDSLWTIAQKVYGDGSKYRLLSRANNLKEPFRIYPNQVLKIPRAAKKVQGPRRSRKSRG